MKEEKIKTTKKRNLAEISRLLIGLLIVVVIGTTYAMIVYENDLTSNSSLVAGDIYIYYNETNQLTLENAMPSEGPDESKYFEFKVSGKNTYTKQDIWYEIQLNLGDKHETRTTRIRDDLLRFRLVEIKDGQETIVVDNQNYASLTNRRIYVNTISKDTKDEIDITYRLYMWIDNNIVIGNTSDADYSIDTWNNNIYGSVKVGVKGDFEEKTVNNSEVVIGNFVETIKSKYGTDSTLIAVNTEGDLYDATNTEQEIREYRYSGPTANNYVYFDTDGDGTKDTNEVWRVVGVFKDTIKDEDGNVVLDSQGNPTYEEEVKLVRNTRLTADELPKSYLINGTTYTIAGSTTSNSVCWNKYTTDYSEKNDWTTAGLQYYLNTEKDENDTSEGSTANAGYLSLLTSEAKEMISPTTYYLGNVDYNVSTVKLSYTQERDATRLWSGNQASWDGLIGMMYPSDYGYSASDLYWETDMYGWNSAESDGVKASSTSWLYQTANHNSTSEWLLSPSSSSFYSAMYWRSTGNVSSYSVYNYIGARPVLNLKSQAKVIDGVGTLEEPYVLVIK